MTDWTEYEKWDFFISQVTNHKALCDYQMGGALFGFEGEKSTDLANSGLNYAYGWFIGSNRACFNLANFSNLLMRFDCVNFDSPRFNTGDFLHTLYKLQSDTFWPSPFDWQDIIGPDHRLFLSISRWPIVTKNCFYWPIHWCISTCNQKH